MTTVRPGIFPIVNDPPTPPEMIELKTYPAVRRAERSGKGASDMGMVKSFFRSSITSRNAGSR